MWCGRSGVRNLQILLYVPLFDARWTVSALRCSRLSRFHSSQPIHRALSSPTPSNLPPLPGFRQPYAFQHVIGVAASAIRSPSRVCLFATLTEGELGLQ